MKLFARSCAGYVEKSAALSIFALSLNAIEPIVERLRLVTLAHNGCEQDGRGIFGRGSHLIPGKQTTAAVAAFLCKAGHEHYVPLKTLGSVNRYQIDSVRGRRELGVEAVQTLPELGHVDGPGILFKRIEKLEVPFCVRLFLWSEVDVTSEGAPCSLNPFG
jgi:hypothetical protein